MDSQNRVMVIGGYNGSDTSGTAFQESYKAAGVIGEILLDACWDYLPAKNRNYATFVYVERVFEPSPEKPCMIIIEFCSRIFLDPSRIKLTKNLKLVPNQTSLGRQILTAGSSSFLFFLKNLLRFIPNLSFS